MALENATSEQAVLAVNDENGTKLDATSDNDENKTTTVPPGSYVSPTSEKHSSKTDKKRLSDLFMLPMPTPSPILEPVPPAAK